MTMVKILLLTAALNKELFFLKANSLKTKEKYYSIIVFYYRSTEKNYLPRKIIVTIIITYFHSFHQIFCGKNTYSRTHKPCLGIVMSFRMVDKLCNAV